MKKSFIKRNTKNAGFTLVETLVAIAILMIAIAGPLTVAEKGLSAAIYARDQMMASYLAQDGMEYVKNVVDTNEIQIHNNSASYDWLYYAQAPNTELVSSTNNSCNSNVNACYVDTITGKISTCSNSLNCPLYLSTNGYSNLTTSGSVTPFTRTYYIQTFQVNGVNNNAANIVMTVTWPGDVVGGGGVILEDTMFDTPLQ